MRKLLTIAALFAASSFGAITDLVVLDSVTTFTQLAITFNAPSSDACTIEASELEDFSVLLNDVNPALFANSNNDLARYPSINVSTSRKFVIGTRAFQRGSNGRVYSRALAAATLHHIRVACGMDTATVSGTTNTLPFGITYVDTPQMSDLYAGELLMPTTFDMPRGAYFIDPYSGTKIYRMTTPGDLDTSANDYPVSSVDSSANWSNPSNILTENGSSATYNGASCGGTCDWIKIKAVSGWNPEYGISVDYARPDILGSGSDANAANRTIEWGYGLLSGGSCAAATLDGETRTLVLPQTTPAYVAATTGRGDTLRPPTALHQILNTEVASGFCLLIRKLTSTGTLTIDNVRIDYAGSSSQSTGSGGNFKWCSDVIDEDGFVLCVSQSGGASAVLYRIKMSPTVDIRYLGVLPAFGGGQCLGPGFSDTVGSRLFCTPNSTALIYQVDYDGDGTNKTAPHTAEVDLTLLESDVDGDMESFTVTNSAHYDFAFDPDLFNCSFVGIVQGDDLQLVCRRFQQDTQAWLGVYRKGTGIVAAYASWYHPMSRWCVHHSYEEIGNYGGLYMWTSQFFKGVDANTGPYTATFVGAVNNSQTTLTLSGQLSTMNGDSHLMNLAVGDVLRMAPVSGTTEYLLITSVASFPTISVQRGYNSSTAVSHPDGAVASGECAGKADGPVPQTGTPMVIWDYNADPYGDGDGISNISYGGHVTHRPGKSINNNSYGFGNLTIGQDYAYPYYTSQQAPWAGHVPPGAGTTYQEHPTWHTTTGTDFAKRVYADVRPFVGGNLLSEHEGVSGCDPTKLLPTSGGCPMQRVAGTSNTYKYTFSGSDRPTPALGDRLMPIFGMARFKHLRNISGPSSLISDATPYTWCKAVLASECRPDSSAGDLYVSAADVNYYGCSGGEGFAGGQDACIGERVAGTVGATEFNTMPPAVASTSIRDIANVNSMATNMRFSSGASIKHLPDGSGVMFTKFAYERFDVFIAKTPPYDDSVIEGADLTTFQELPIEVMSVPSGATRLLAKFGTDQSLKGSPNRDEETYAVLSSINEETPFLWASELTNSSGVDVSGGCGSGCTVMIPAIPGHVMFYELVWRNAMGEIVETSAMSFGGGEPPAPTAPDITTSSLPAGTIGAAYSQTLSAAGSSPKTWTLQMGTQLPTGLSLSSGGVISGTATETGIFIFTVIATNSVDSDSRELSITINPSGGSSNSFTIHGTPTIKGNVQVRF